MLYTYSSATREAEEEEKLQLKASLDSTVRWCLKREREKSITGKKESIHKAMGSFSNTAKLFKIPWVSNLSSYCKKGLKLKLGCRILTSHTQGLNSIPRATIRTVLKEGKDRLPAVTKE